MTVLGRKEGPAPYGAGSEAKGLRLEAVEWAVVVQNLRAVQRLPGSTTNAESRPSQIGPISLEEKQTGERSARKSARCVRRGGLETWHGRDGVTLADQQGTQTSI
jgi:hypothetical protein